MAAIEKAGSAHTNRLYVAWTGTALALVAALAYLLIELGALAVGDLAAAEEPAFIVYVAAACYAAGGLLIPLRWRWLLLAGAVMNALVILFFAMAYAGRPSVMFSPGGLATKGAQILLEICLFYLIVTNGRREGRAH
jgi:hypothetical protein